MNHLLRELAPISDAGWDVLDREAKERLTPALAARRLVELSGPHGWSHSATNLGRTAPLGPAPFADGVSGLTRRVLPLVELRADFELSRAQLRDADRGADDIDLGALDSAAHQLAVAENLAVLDGWPEAIRGIVQASPHDPVSLGTGAAGYAQAVAGAVALLLQSGIAGPYGLTLGSNEYTDVLGTAEHGGYPLASHVREIIGGPIVWAPGLNGALLLSQRGGDFILDSGQDVSIGYQSHDDETVRLYLQESFSFRVATPEAAVAIRA